MNCPVHTKEQILFVRNISLHHIDGFTEMLPLYGCKKCDQYYISSKSLNKDFSRRLQNGKIVKNFYENSTLNNNHHIQKNKKEPSSYVDHIGPDKEKLHVYLYQKGFSKICPRCHTTLLALKITFPSKKGIRYIYGKKCPSCEMNYLHINNYLNKRESFSVENKEILNSLTFVKNTINESVNSLKKDKGNTTVKNVINSKKNNLGRVTISKTSNIILDKNEIRYLMCDYVIYALVI